MEICGAIQRPRFAGGFNGEYPECLRHVSHVGEHLGKDASGVYVIFWTDLACQCEACQSSEPSDWCEPFSHIDASQAETLLASPTATLLDWDADVVQLRK